MIRIAVLQHVAHEGPGRIADWLAWRGLEASVYPLYRDPALPALDSFDLLIVLGGPMNVDQELQYPWLVAEKQLIRDALASGKRLLGICLGGQLLAEALGASVAPMGQAEIGWWRLEKHPESRHSPIGRMLPQGLLALHWHSQAFELPVGTIPLYGTAVCPQQGFVWEERAVALQFHLESTPDCIDALLQHAADDLQLAGAVQDRATISDGQPLCSGLSMPLYRLLDYLTGPHATLC